MAFTRRDSLRLGGGALAALALPNCTGVRPKLPPRPITGNLIDVHCHLFNGTDLPITTFLTRLILPSYDPKTCPLGPKPDFRSSGTIEDPDLVEMLIAKIVDWLLGNTPTACAELASLKRDQISTVTSESGRVRTLTRDRLAEFLARPPEPALSRRADTTNRLRDALWQEAGTTSGDMTLRSKTNRRAATTLLASRGQYGALLRWVQLFFRSRQSLAQELSGFSHSWGRQPLMLVPLMVDYAHWLGQTTSKDSSFPEQVAVFGELARRSAVPLHGMVAYDPLRAVFWKRGLHKRFPTPEFDPLALARHAVTKEGFVGLKLYPPMGFRATGNPPDDAAYPPAVIKALRPKGTLGDQLDQAMNDAFALCTELDVPILAHANNSLSAGPGFGARAEPRYWIKALEGRPTLRLCLAHQGGFCWPETAPSAKGTTTGSSWEWAIGRYVRDHPASHLYMDISYFSELIRSGNRLGYVADQLMAWIRDCDRDVRHILFGTDWTMIGKERGFAAYGLTVERFLTDRCHLTEAQINRVMWQNAMRFLGLDAGKNRARLLDFYGSRRPDWTRIDLSGNP